MLEVSRAEATRPEVYGLAELVWAVENTAASKLSKVGIDNLKRALATFTE